MKLIVMSLTFVFSVAANASSITGQVSFVCNSPTNPKFSVGVYKDINDPTGQNVFVTTPLGFLGRSLVVSTASGLSIDVPKVFGQAGDETLEIETKKDYCHPSADLKLKNGSHTALVCTNNDSAC